MVSSGKYLLIIVGIFIVWTFAASRNKQRHDGSQNI